MASVFRHAKSIVFLQKGHSINVDHYANLQEQEINERHVYRAKYSRDKKLLRICTKLFYVQCSKFSTPQLRLNRYRMTHVEFVINLQ